MNERLTYRRPPTIRHGLGWMLAIAAWMLGVPHALAHKPSDSYLRLRGGEDTLQIQWDIALKDLETVIGLDDNSDGEITWGEVRSRGRDIAAYALGRLRVSGDGESYRVLANDLLFVRHSDGGYAVLVLQTDCPGDVKELEIGYQLLFDIDPTHRGLVLYENGSLASTHVIGPENPFLKFDTGEVGRWRAFGQYVREGVWHIWIGFDHILFLIALLIPSVLIRERRRWKPVANFRPAFRSVLRIVTVFTIAHSITLWLAVSGYVTLPSRLVEATIAASIIVTALNNLYPLMKFKPWIIAFTFGLIHGFGFAGVLLDLGLSSSTLAISLLGFNVGVELGQLAIVAVFLPLAYRFRGQRFYRHHVLGTGSWVIGIVAAAWMIERVFAVDLPLL